MKLLINYEQEGGQSPFIVVVLPDYLWMGISFEEIFQAIFAIFKLLEKMALFEEIQLKSGSGDWGWN